MQFTLNTVANSTFTKLNVLFSLAVPPDPAREENRDPSDEIQSPPMTSDRCV